MEEDIGETRRKTFSEQTSFGHEQVRDGISFGKDEERINIVSYSDVQSLNDLECFVTLPGDYPVVRLNMKYQGMPKVAESLLMRNLKTNLDQDIERELDSRDDARRRQMDALFSTGDEPQVAAVVNNSAPSEPSPKTDTAVDGIASPLPDAVSARPAAPVSQSAAASAATAGGGTQQEQVRREEVNINHPQEHCDKEWEYL